MKSFSKFSLVRENSLVLYSDYFLCNFRSELPYDKIIGKKLLIFGESNTGKTELTSKILSFIRTHPDIGTIFVLDLGPERFQIQSIEYGGKLTDYDEKVKDDSKVYFYTYPIIPPRSYSSNTSEVYKNCLKNFSLIHNDFIITIDKILGQKGKYELIINDLTIFLHLGSYFPLLKILKTNQTVVVNAYYGEKLANDFGSNISWRERMIVQALCRHFDYPIHLIK